MSKSHVGVWTLSFLASILCVHAGSAQNYPAKPLRFLAGARAREHPGTDPLRELDALLLERPSGRRE